MMSRTQITLEPEFHRKARQRASDLGISLAEYVRQLITKDVGKSAPPVSPTALFDLGDSGGSNIAANKDVMIAEALVADLRKSHRRSA